jgi:hypothetical protein
VFEGVGVVFFPLVRILSGWLNTVNCVDGVNLMHISKAGMANWGEAQKTIF